MKTTKRMLKHPYVQALLCWVVAQYIRLVLCTSRVERHIAPQAVPYMRGDMQAVFAFWHGRLLLFPCFKPRQRALHVLISGHQDGQLIARVVAHFNVAAVEGSSSKRSLSSVRELLRLMKQGHNIAITPDGPRGPFQQAAPGVAYLARAAGLPVLPLAWSAVRGKRLRSWDRFMIPWPFTRIIVVAGAPLAISKAQEDAQTSTLITDALIEVTVQADTLSRQERASC